MTEKKPYGEVLDEMDHQSKYQPATEPRALRPLDPLLPGETCSEYLDRLARAEAGNTQQLVARIKRSSKYYGQTEPGSWFDVRVVADTYYHLRGNNEMTLNTATMIEALQLWIDSKFKEGAAPKVISVVQLGSPACDFKIGLESPGIKD